LQLSDLTVILPFLEVFFNLPARKIRLHNVEGDSFAVNKISMLTKAAQYAFIAWFKTLPERVDEESPSC
jgi:hypothetical protein